MTIAQLLKHDFKSKGSLYLYDTNGNIIYCENSNGYWSKYEYDSNKKQIYYENSMVKSLITDQRLHVMVRLWRLKERNIN
jgi:hypothetical protein